MSGCRSLPSRLNRASAAENLGLPTTANGHTQSFDTRAMMNPLPLFISVLGLVMAGLPTLAQEAALSDQERAAELAKKLSNPVAALISVPLQNNFDFGAGPNDDGFQYRLNIQPVVPISLNEDWNLISRTILPFICQEDVIGTSSQTGLGDTVQSLFLSPQAPGPGGLIWGAGPVLLLPTATDSLLGAEQWGAGPTVVVLKQQKGWTYGALANHLWSFAGNGSRTEVNATFLQPFVAYTTKKQTTFTLNSESTYDWEREQWTAPLNLLVAQLVKVKNHPVQFQLGARYYVESPANGPEWGLRASVVFLFPR